MRISRVESTDEGTFGVVALKGMSCYSVELPWRDNQRQVSCIPTGKYLCKLVNSPRFGKVYQVTGVPGRSNILIHPANVAGDVSKGFKTELQGCIALCGRLGWIKGQRAGLLSRPTVAQFMSIMGGNPFELEIR